MLDTNVKFFELGIGLMFKDSQKEGFKEEDSTFLLFKAK
jgi:hypothetical protein